MSDEEKKTWERLWKVAKQTNTVFNDEEAEKTVRDPKLRAEFNEEQRRQAINRVGDALSRATKVLDVPIDVIGKILEIPDNDFWALRSAGRILTDAGVEADHETLAEAIDMAKVARIMDDPSNNMPIGVTGVTGPVGPSGSPGFYCPTGPVGMSGPSAPTGPTGAVGSPSANLSSAAPGANGPAGPPGQPP
jgi:hypothetical protein